MAIHARSRGTLSDIPGRFDRIQCQTEQAPEARATRYHHERARTLVSENQSPDLPFSYSINPYRGCEHGCIYCYARPNHAYVDLSPGQDFESEIFCKDNAAEVLRETLRQRRYRCRPLMLGSATDPYQPIERQRRLTREILQVLSDCRHPVSVTTKSHLILRDLDLLSPMAAAGRASVAVSVTTLDNRLKGELEPRANKGTQRLHTVRELTRAGVPVTVLVAPIIPFINDQEMEDIIFQSVEAGAQEVSYTVLRLPHEVGPLWQQWLQEYYPDRAEKVMGVMRELHGGAIYNSRWHHRHTGQGAWAQLLQQRFEQARRRAGLGESQQTELDCRAFRPPGPHGQLSLWD